MLYSVELRNQSSHCISQSNYIASLIASAKVRLFIITAKLFLYFFHYKINLHLVKQAIGYDNTQPQNELGQLGEMLQ